MKMKIPAYIVKFDNDYKYLSIKDKLYDENGELKSLNYYRVISILDANFYTDYEEAKSDAEMMVEGTNEGYIIKDVFIQYETEKE